MSDNINTRAYWDSRFASNDWEAKSGRRQTRLFAEEQCERLGLPSTFSGIIADFGCGLGDAMPVYRTCFPQATLRGYDLSNEAIRKCREKYGGMATFEQGEADDVKVSDVIIASNVFEHLSNDRKVLKTLLAKCSLLYVVVPYREKIVDPSEHVNSYNENSFREYEREIRIYRTKGMGEHGWRVFYNIYIKNFYRLLAGKTIVRNLNKQIMYVFRGDS